MKKYLKAVPVLCMAIMSYTAHSQVFNLLKDINTFHNPLSSSPDYLTAIGSVVYFRAADRVNGEELWRSDGTAAGTVLVKDIWAGFNSSLPENITNVNAILFFTAMDASNGRELWKNDGTAAGTVLVKDINPGSADSGPQYLTNVNGMLYFNADDGTNGPELWKSDGTAAGTVLVKDINPGSAGSLPYLYFYFPYYTNVNGMLYFTAVDGTNGEELWKSDGTAAGTVLVKDINPGSASSSPCYLTNLNGMLYFNADNGAKGSELWKSDGTAAGTVLVKDIKPGPTGSGPCYLTNVNGTLFFYAQDASNGLELWKSDGTAAGTVLVKDINPGSAGSLPVSPFYTNVNGMLYFAADDGTNGVELWKSDGTAAGTVLVKDINPGSAGSLLYWDHYLTNVNGVVYFHADNGVNGYELWKSDGTAAGTVLVKDIYPGPNSSITYGGRQTHIDVNGALYFSAVDGVNDYELWKSDGTAAGTVMVKDINGGTNGSYPRDLTNVNGVLYFSADDGWDPPAANANRELWKSDGTAAGTVLVKDILPGAAGSSPEYLTNVNGLLFFSANDGTYGTELWKSDGTAAGTALVKDIYPGATVNFPPENLTNVNGILFFSANDGIFGRELWKSDGTTAGTVLVKNIAAPGNSNPQYLTDVNGTLFFAAQDASNGYELWKSDGTAAGTVLVKDIYPGPYSSINGPQTFINVNGVLYFTADDGVNGLEIWKSDGTAAGTVMVKDINPGGYSYPLYLTNVNGVLYFRADDGVNGLELWKSDGTAAGTVMVKDINPGGYSYPLYLTNVNGVLYFTADNGANGQELWKSDGTAAGTVLVKDIWPGIIGSSPSSLTAIDNKLLFQANDGINGEAVWLSDGTAAGTVMVQDIANYNEFFPHYYTLAGSKIFALVTTQEYGVELWAANAATVLPVSLLEFNGHLINGNGALSWKTTDEQNTASFDIERSVDGRTYTAIGNTAAFNSPGVHQYNYTDNNIVSLGSPVVYYRLKQKDIDGRSTYSRIVALSLDNSKSIILFYPNPVINEASLTITVNKPEKLQGRIIDNTGRVVKQQQWDLQAGSISLPVDVKGLARGMYWLELKGETINDRKVFVKQ